MSSKLTLSRRSTLRVLGLCVLVTTVPAFAADALPLVVVNKDPSCGCCEKWADHLITAGFPVEVIARTDMQAVKAKFGVPGDLVSCHTATVGGYVIEGHVPATAIVRLLAEKPTATGLAVPGMPIGSPGMEGGTPEDYEVVLFGPSVRRVYGRFRDGREI